MSNQKEKSKMIIFLVNTLRQPLYIIQQATKSDPELAEEDTLVFIISTEESALRNEEPDIGIQQLTSQNYLVVQSEYPLYKLMTLRDDDFIFNEQHSFLEEKRIAVTVLTKRELANLN